MENIQDRDNKLQGIHLVLYIFTWASIFLLLVFHGKDLCEAIVNFEVCSYLADGHPPQSSIDLWKTTTPNKFHI